MARQNIIKRTDIHQKLLLPVDMTEWLSDDDVVYAITDTLPLLDLSDFYTEYRKDGIGGSFYDPVCMLGILMYALVRGERSSRKIELACRFDIGYRIAGQNIQPAIRQYSGSGSDLHHS
jgi:transposase